MDDLGVPLSMETSILIPYKGRNVVQIPLKIYCVATLWRFGHKKSL